jgi:hypothetical protein
MKKTIRYDHQLTPYALKLVADVEARQARANRLKVIREAGARADAKLRRKSS